jgi:hypothetical protein
MRSATRVNGPSPERAATTRMCQLRPFRVVVKVFRISVHPGQPALLFDPKDWRPFAQSDLRNCRRVAEAQRSPR